MQRDETTAGIAMSEHKTDWDIVVKGFITVLWCARSCELSDSSKPFDGVFSDFLKETSFGVLPMNIGTMMMASYLMFVYPRQRELDSLPYQHISIDRFAQGEEAATDKKTFIRRLRNALAHGRWDVEADRICFKDRRWSASVSAEDFGAFLKQFLQKALFNALTGTPSGMVTSQQGN